MSSDIGKDTENNKGSDIAFDFGIEETSNEDHLEILRERMKVPVPKEKTTTSKAQPIDTDETTDHFIDILIETLVDNPEQPRRSYNKEEIADLAATIRKDGLLHPIGVTKEGEQYVIIYGHRRVRAYKMLKLTSIKALVKASVTSKEKRTLALIENLQRTNMHIMDTALSLHQSLKNGDYKNQSKLAEAIGKDRTYVSKALKLLTLPDEIINDLVENKSICDSFALDLIRRIQGDEATKEVYYWHIKNKPNRADLEKKIESLKKESIQDTTILIKKTKSGYTIKTPRLSDEKYKKLENFINNLI